MGIAGRLHASPCNQSPQRSITLCRFLTALSSAASSPVPREENRMGTSAGGESGEEQESEGAEGCGVELRAVKQPSGRERGPSPASR